MHVDPKVIVATNINPKMVGAKPQGKSLVLSLGEIYRVAKILKISTRLYKPLILLYHPSSSTVLAAVLDECVDWWLGSGLEEALQDSTNDNDYSAGHQLLESRKCIDEVDAFIFHVCITSATAPTCCISGLNTEIVPGIETVEWNGEHYLVSLANNLRASLISRDSPDLAGHSLFVNRCS
ncbi:hypothetical protein Rs2_16460 [Raphanus sativus]|nr:hypothetical protein Rs2_16460 [Raphanus sativus]